MPSAQTLRLYTSPQSHSLRAPGTMRPRGRRASTASWYQNTLGSSSAELSASANNGAQGGSQDQQVVPSMLDSLPAKLAMMSGNRGQCPSTCARLRRATNSLKSARAHLS